MGPVDRVRPTGPGVGPDGDQDRAQAPVLFAIFVRDLKLIRWEAPKPAAAEAATRRASEVRDLWATQDDGRRLRSAGAILSCYEDQKGGRP